MKTRIGRARAILAAAAVAASALAGCVSTGGGGEKPGEMPMTPYTMVPTGRAWLYVPTGILTLERTTGRASEQRVILPNPTAYPGDNFLLMRTRRSEGAYGGGRLKLENFLEGSGGLPAPFSSVRTSQLQSAEDDLGSYFFLTESAGPGATCVLALRPVSGAARMLPQGADAVDVLMRNCVGGTQADALKPILAGALGRSVAPTSGEGQATLRNMSPFAAPQVN